MEKKRIEILDIQAFQIWRQLKVSQTYGYGTLMDKLWKAFGGSESKYYKRWKREQEKKEDKF